MTEIMKEILKKINYNYNINTIKMNNLENNLIKNEQKKSIMDDIKIHISSSKIQLTNDKKDYYMWSLLVIFILLILYHC